MRKIMFAFLAFYVAESEACVFLGPNYYTPGHSLCIYEAGPYTGDTPLGRGYRCGPTGGPGCISGDGTETVVAPNSNFYIFRAQDQTTYKCYQAAGFTGNDDSYWVVVNDVPYMKQVASTTVANAFCNKNVVSNGSSASVCTWETNGTSPIDFCNNNYYVANSYTQCLPCPCMTDTGGAERCGTSSGKGFVSSCVMSTSYIFPDTVGNYQFSTDCPASS